MLTTHDASDAPRIVAQTERLLLREFSSDDATDLYSLNADPEVLRHTGDEPFADFVDAHAFVHAYRREVYATLGFGRWSMVRRDDGAFLGWCGLGKRGGQEQVDIGFRLRRDCWGAGYATEAARACLHIAFETLQLRQVIARARPANAASLRVIARLGMQPDDATDPTDDDMLRFVLTNDRWREMHATRHMHART